MSVVQLNYQSLCCCCSSACRTLNYLFPMRAIKVQNIGPLNYSAPTTTTTTYKNSFREEKVYHRSSAAGASHSAQSWTTTDDNCHWARVCLLSFIHSCSLAFIHSLIGPVEGPLQKEADSLKRTVSLCF